eukprot:366008-Chlamydomonas_euryale.AAC.2
MKRGSATPNQCCMLVRLDSTVRVCLLADIASRCDPGTTGAAHGGIVSRWGGAWRQAAHGGIVSRWGGAWRQAEGWWCRMGFMMREVQGGGWQLRFAACGASLARAPEGRPTVLIVWLTRLYGGGVCAQGVTYQRHVVARQQDVLLWVLLQAVAQAAAGSHGGGGV